MSNLPKIILAIENHRAYDQGLLNGISRYANLNGRWLFLYEKDGIHRSLHSIEKIKPDGVIVRISKNEKVIEKIPDKMPCIILGAGETINGRINIIGDSDRIGEMAAEYLLSLGFKNFGFCGVEREIWSHKRAVSYTKVLRNAGYDVSSYSYPFSAKSDFARELPAMMEWIESLSKPIGIMASNDERGFHVLEACKAAGVNVPEEVAVLGVDNDVANCEFATPPLSSIALSTAKAGYEAARLLDSMMREGVSSVGKKEVVVKPTHVVARQSTSVFAVPDKVVAEALDFIRNNVKMQIQVSDVAEFVSVSRRELERRFKRYLNHSIHQEIKLKKVQLITKMLLETSDTISEIASELGFSSIAHISRYFRDIEGVSPIEYRRRNLCVV
ncbi:MAG: hypothetical protein DRP62_00125 [Planctomycetota bacterium]|nr:MAG: hypothetical protein DRP62_00125 [Planctomycetota bacterium]